MDVVICHLWFNPRGSRTNQPSYYQPQAFAYSVDGSPATNPSFPLFAGTTNTLTINTTPGAFGHPVVITTNNQSVGARFTMPPPAEYQQRHHYCEGPGQLRGARWTTCAPCTQVLVNRHRGAAEPNGPPPNQIVSIKVTPNVVITSTGTNTTWTLVPEYSSNPGQWPLGARADLYYTFANGTNTTTFDRLDPICGPVRLPPSKPAKELKSTCNRTARNLQRLRADETGTKGNSLG